MSKAPKADPQIGARVMILHPFYAGHQSGEVLGYKKFWTGIDYEMHWLVLLDRPIEIEGQVHKAVAAKDAYVMLQSEYESRL